MWRARCRVLALLPLAHAFIARSPAPFAFRPRLRRRAPAARALSSDGAAAVITGYGEDAFEPARDAGVDVVLRKPISRKELGEAIDRLLEAAS